MVSYEIYQGILSNISYFSIQKVLLLDAGTLKCKITQLWNVCSIICQCFIQRRSRRFRMKVYIFLTNYQIFHPFLIQNYYYCMQALWSAGSLKSEGLKFDIVIFPYQIIPKWTKIKVWNFFRIWSNISYFPMKIKILLLDEGILKCKLFSSYPQLSWHAVSLCLGMNGFIPPFI